MQHYFKKVSIHRPVIDIRLELLQSEIMTVPVDHHNTSGQFNPNLHGDGPLGVTVGGFSQDIDELVMGRVDNTHFRFIEDYEDGSPIGLGMFMQRKTLNRRLTPIRLGPDHNPQRIPD
jgi:hypothetical protein